MASKSSNFPELLLYMKTELVLNNQRHDEIKLEVKRVLTVRRCKDDIDVSDFIDFSEGERGAAS